ncbi:Chitinase A1 precursor [compost metagenome]
MKQVNFSHSGGFPLEQETLERLQTAYRSELYEALKRHLSIDNNNDYIVAQATSEAKGWAVIRQEDAVNPENQTGILYPIKNGTPTNYLKTTRTETNLIYGTGDSQPAYYDYEAEYSPAKLNDGVFVSESGQVQTVYYYDLRNFEIVKDIQAIEEILQAIQSNINAIEANIDVVEGDINAIEGNINVIKADINLINQSYLPLNGSKAMQGDLDLGTHQLSKLDIKEGSAANVRVEDFKLGSINRRGLLHPNDYLGRALVDSSTSSATSLTLNYGPDWENTYVNGKIYFNNADTSLEDFTVAKRSDNSLLLIDGLNQVLKSNNLLNSLLKRITDLEEKPATAVPLGMVAIWGKPAPFPEGWEEYVPLRGKMPVGLYNPTPQERIDQQDADGGNGLTYYRDSFNSPVFPFDTLGYGAGRIGKKILTEEMPPHYHHKPNSHFKSFAAGSGDYGNSSSTGTGADGGDNSQMAIGNLGSNYNTNGDALEQTVGGGKSFTMLNPYRVVQFIEYTGRPKDAVAPTPPTNLTVSNITNTSLKLNWTASTDEYGVTNYLVYKNDTLLAPLGNVLSYTVTGLTADTSYSFYIMAKDAEGNSSLKSNTVNPTTTNVDTTIPTNFDGYLQSENEMYISWNAPASPGVVSYDIWRRQAGSGNSSPHDTTVGSRTYYYDTGLFDTTYFFKVRALYNTGNYSGFTDEVAITTEPRVIECFDVESLVTMASGQSKKLKNIVVGDKLQGFSFPNEIDESAGDYMIWSGKLEEASKAEVTVVNKITSVQPDYYEIKTADTTIKVTGQHPLLVTEDGENVQWVCVKNVAQTMLLIDKTGKTKAIESITFKEEPLEVALLDVENVDNYVISGIVAHNNKPLDPPVNP